MLVGLDSLSNVFYDPWIFWGVPLIFAFLWEGYVRLKDRMRGRF